MARPLSPTETAAALRSGVEVEQFVSLDAGSVVYLKVGRGYYVDPVTAGREWAVEVDLVAGLTLGLEGPVSTRGDVGPLAPFLLSGAWL